jgi:UDP-glucose 4-epimerase
MPFISQVAVGQRERVFVFGNDFPTVDGTGVRDYIHVVDLAKGHVKALEKLLLQTGVVVANLGPGRGYSVLELIYAFRKCSDRKIPFEVVARRKGDVAQCYADSSYANQWLSWQAKLDMDRMCEDTWRWQERNPCGYES